MQRKEKNPPRVSVLMANYNGERFLAEAIESILSQSFTDFELIVVDDGSTDTSASLLDFYAKKDKRLRVFHFLKNRGFVRALNHGLRFARGEYVARMDSDDLCHRDRLMQQVSYLDKHKRVHVVGCHYRAIDEKGFFCSLAYAKGFMDPVPVSFGRHRVAKKILLFRYPVLHATIVCRYSTLVSVSGYREFLPVSEDDDLYSRIVNLHGRVLDNLSKKLYYYRHYGNSTTHRFSYPFRMLIIHLLALSLEFRRRGFWDPLEECSSAACRSLRFQGVSSLLFLQDSLVFLPHRCPREGLYSLLRVIVILRRFDLKDFRHLSLLSEWGITMNKQIYFYTSFCIACFRVKKIRVGFLYFRYILNLYCYVSFFTALFSFFTVLFSLIKVLFSFLAVIFSLIFLFLKTQKDTFIVFFIVFKDTFIVFKDKFIVFTERCSNNHLFLSRSLIFSNRWHHGVKHLLIAFFYNPFFVTKFFFIRLLAHSSRTMHVLYRKLGF